MIYFVKENQRTLYDNPNHFWFMNRTKFDELLKELTCRILLKSLITTFDNGDIFLESNVLTLLIFFVSDDTVLIKLK